MPEAPQDRPPAQATPPTGVVRAPEVNGRRFLLWFVLPVLVLSALLFLYFKPERPLGGPQGRFAPPDYFRDKVEGRPQPGNDNPGGP